MANRNRLPKFSAEIIDDNETVYFYLVQDINYDEPHSIKSFIAPFTNAGRTQNLGRFNMKLDYNLLIVKYVKDGRVISIDETINKFSSIKRGRKKLRLSIPYLPIGSSVFYMGGVNIVLKEPNRLVFSTTFTEVLQDSLNRNIQNLVLNNSMENIKALLQQRGQI